MTAAPPPLAVPTGRRPVAPVGLQAGGRWLALLAAVGLVMHGCHGPDEDHEPAAAPVREKAP